VKKDDEDTYERSAHISPPFGLNPLELHGVGTPPNRRTEKEEACMENET